MSEIESIIAEMAEPMVKVMEASINTDGLCGMVYFTEDQVLRFDPVDIRATERMDGEERG